MSGIEVAASAAGLVSLVFKGCIEAFQFLQLAAQLGDDANLLRCKLEWEQFRLYQWAEQVGLEDRPDNRLNWTLASSILRQLEALLTSSQEWKERYHLDVAEVGRSVPGQKDPAKNPPSKKPGFGFILHKLKPNYASTSSRIIQESNSSVKRLEWAAVGRDKLIRLIDDISYFNKCLHSLLESADRNFVTAALGALLRDIIARSNVSSELDVVKELLQSTAVASPDAIASAASLKKIRLVLGLGKTPDVASGVRPKLMYLKAKHLVRESMYNYPRGREVARYKSDLILVEWRFIQKALEPQMKSRVDQIAILLGNTDETYFHSLHCMGVLPKDPAYQPEDDNLVCYGLVFDLHMSQQKITASSPSAVVTLVDLYSKSRRPSLNERLNIAFELAETVLQLHTTGWLHKGIRPDNICFLQRDNETWDAGAARGPYLCGYEYARPANVETENIPERPEMELYRHPSAQGPAKSNFNKSFDLFALGCILLEIALWTSLENLLMNLNLSDQSISEKRSSEKALRWTHILSAKDRLLCKDKVSLRHANVSFCAGETFEEVISLCLHAAASDDPDDESLETQKLIVDKLRGCNF